MSDCDAVLAPQVFHETSSLDSKIAALDSIDSTTWEQLKGNMGGSVILEGLPLGGTFEAMKESLEEYKRTVSYDADEDASNAILNRTIDPGQVAAWSECMASTNSGLVVSFVPRLSEQDSTTATLKITFTPPAGLTSIGIVIEVEQGGDVAGDSTFDLPAHGDRYVLINREENALLLKVIVHGTFPNGAGQDVEQAYFWELPTLAPYPICGIFSGPGELGTVVEIHPGMPGPACRQQTETVARARPDLNPNFRMGVADPDNGQLFVSGVLVRFGAMNDDVTPLVRSSD